MAIFNRFFVKRLAKFNIMADVDVVTRSPLVSPILSASPLHSRRIWREMKRGKDEGKSMDPLFPRLHISDADKGGPRAPPRNKMALCEQYNVTSQTPRFTTMLSLSSSNAGSSFASKASSTQVGCYQKIILPTLCGLPGSSNAMERYPSYSSVGLNLDTGMKISRDENEIKLPSFLQSEISLDYGNLDSHLDKAKIAAFSSISPGKLQRSREHRKNQSDKENSPSQTTNLHAKNLLHVLSMGKKRLADAALSPQPGDKISKPDNKALITVNQTTRKRSASAMEDLSNLTLLLGQSNKSFINLESVNEFSKNKDGSRVGNGDRKKGTSDISPASSLPGLDLAPDDVVGAIGLELFWKARRTILDQQRVFAVQVFELHRLIQVQRFMAGSPEVLYENIYLSKPPIKFPAVNKLLTDNILEPPTSTVAKPKPDPQKSNPSKDLGTESLCGTDKGRLAQKSTHNPSPPSMPIDPKLAPWCLHPPSGNQWLVPVRSPTEGLIYKPFTGLCPPPVGFMAPVYGNCGPITGFGCLSNTGLGHNYFQQCALPIGPILTTNIPNLEVKQMTQFFGDHSTGPDKLTSAREVNLSLPSQQSGVVSKESDLQGSTGSSPEWSQGEGLSLFPMTPTFKGLDRKCNVEQQQEVIKVVPHNPKTASESAARIFLSIQEERKKHQ